MNHRFFLTILVMSAGLCSGATGPVKPDSTLKKAAADSALGQSRAVAGIDTAAKTSVDTALKALPADTATKTTAIDTAKNIIPDSAAAVTVADTTPKAAADTAATVPREKLPAEEEEIAVLGKSAPDYRSPRRAMFYSFLIPGLGQYYAHSKLKAALFVAIEAAGFGFRYNFLKRGDDANTAFIAFVSNHYNSAAYEDWYRTVGTNIDSNNVGFQKLHIDSGTYRDFSQQQYYENITKDRQFVYGWDDTKPELSVLAAGQAGDPIDSINNQPASIVDNYIITFYDTEYGRYDTSFGYSARQVEANHKRGLSNDEYRKADNLWFAILANHLVSGVDAALTAWRHNRSQLQLKSSLLDKISVEDRVHAGIYGPVHVFTLTMAF